MRFLAPAVMNMSIGGHDRRLLLKYEELNRDAQPMPATYRKPACEKLRRTGAHHTAKEPLQNSVLTGSHNVCEVRCRRSEDETSQSGRGLLAQGQEHAQARVFAANRAGGAVAGLGSAHYPAYTHC